MTLSDARQCARAVLSGHFEASLVLVSGAVRVGLVDATRLTRSAFTRHDDNIDCPWWPLNDVAGRPWRGLAAGGWRSGHGPGETNVSIAVGGPVTPTGR